MSVEKFESGTWSQFVDSHEHATPFHTIAWKRAIQSTFGYKPHYRLIRRNDKFVGALPGFATGGILGNNIVQPFCEYGYPLITSDADPSELLRVLTKVRKRFDTRIIKEAPWSGNIGYSDSDFAGVETGVTFRLFLDRPYDQLYQERFETEVRRNIQIANNAGVSIQEGEERSAIDTYYHHYLQTMRRLASPPFPQSFFHALKREFGENCTVLLAEVNGTTIGGVLTLSHKNQTVIWSSASDDEHWDKSPNYLLYASVIERVCSNHTVVDFGRTRLKSGVHTFKRQFGGREHSLVSMVSPAHRVKKGSINQYRRLEPIVKQFSPVITNRWLGPRLKEWLHE